MNNSYDDDDSNDNNDTHSVLSPEVEDGRSVSIKQVCKKRRVKETSNTRRLPIQMEQFYEMMMYLLKEWKKLVIGQA